MAKKVNHGTNMRDILNVTFLQRGLGKHKRNMLCTQRVKQLPAVVLLNTVYYFKKSVYTRAALT